MSKSQTTFRYSPYLHELSAEPAARVVTLGEVYTYGLDLDLSLRTEGANERHDTPEFLRLPWSLLPLLSGEQPAAETRR